MMLSYVHGTGSVALLGETIGTALDRAAARYGDRDALISCHQNLRYTYGELRREVNRAARALLALGVERGDRVGIWSANTAEWPIVQYAAAKAGAILVNINPSYRLRELDYALNQAGVSVLVAARSFRKANYVEMLTTLMPELTAPRRGSLETEKVPALRHLIYLGSDPAPGGIAWTEFVAQGDRVSAAHLSAREALLQFDDPVNIQYTSGTTGSPKGATLSHHNILNNGFFVGEALEYTHEDRICVPLPVSLDRPQRGLGVERFGGNHNRGAVGYWNNSEATASAIDAAGWMHTGDLAIMDDNGYVNISGRLKDMIIRGGENIYPREIEEFLYTHPKISDVQVIGVPDLKYGEEVCAWVRLREDQTATEDEIREFCRGQIASCKIPRYLRFTSEFPTTVTGKIQKFRMREVSIEELGLSRAAAIKTA